MHFLADHAIKGCHQSRCLPVPAVGKGGRIGGTGGGWPAGKETCCRHCVCARPQLRAGCARSRPDSSPGFVGRRCRGRLLFLFWRLGQRHVAVLARPPGLPVPELSPAASSCASPAAGPDRWPPQGSIEGPACSRLPAAPRPPFVWKCRSWPKPSPSPRPAPVPILLGVCRTLRPLDEEDQASRLHCAADWPQASGRGLVLGGTWVSDWKLDKCGQGFWRWVLECSNSPEKDAGNYDLLGTEVSNSSAPLHFGWDLSLNF